MCRLTLSKHDDQRDELDEQSASIDNCCRFRPTVPSKWELRCQFLFRCDCRMRIGYGFGPSRSSARPTLSPCVVGVITTLVMSLAVLHRRLTRRVKYSRNIATLDLLLKLKFLVYHIPPSRSRTKSKI